MHNKTNPDWITEASGQFLFQYTIKFQQYTDNLSRIHIGQEFLQRLLAELAHNDIIRLPGHDLHTGFEQCGELFGRHVGPDVAPPAGDLETARLYGARVATTTLRFVRGKQ